MSTTSVYCVEEISAEVELGPAGLDVIPVQTTRWCCATTQPLFMKIIETQNFPFMSLKTS